ncbi:MAG TPA: Spx/MgsR family RNA polymerase-binding regulatory protein [Phnomibacter sp.]|nr:Spx/MgsR family RNA polymerase-binding regulatory protein [Phnomibacter sp.]
MITVYGIPNCDTVKKTVDYLKQHNIPFAFHNYKTEGISKLQLKNWSKQVGYELLLNKKSTTWKACTPEEQTAAAKPGGAIELMAKANSLIKRPVIEKDGAVIAVGFKADELLQKIKG